MRQSSLLVSISKLSKYQRAQLERFVIDSLNLNSEYENIQPDICPFCNQHSKMIKKGFRKDKQRFQCKECGHIFAYDSHTITACLKIEKSKFYEIVLDTLNFVAIKTTAARLDLSVQTVFENRHKLLCALEALLDKEPELLVGTIEIDETYELESQKGNRNIIRKARRRGEPSKYRGLSHEQICIVTTTNRTGHEIFKHVGFGKPTSNSILNVLQEKLAPNSIIYTDGAFCYDQLAKTAQCKLVQLKTHSSYNTVEHLNTVNNIHSLIKKRLQEYRGIATKYMNRYLSLFVFVRRFLDMDDNEKMPILIQKLRTLHISITRLSLKTTIMS